MFLSDTAETICWDRKGQERVSFYKDTKPDIALRKLPDWVLKTKNKTTFRYFFLLKELDKITTKLNPLTRYTFIYL